MIAAFRGRLAALAGAAILSGAAGAQEPPPAPSPFSFEASLGHESLSSPVVRIDPASALILVDGTTRLRGAYGRLAGSLFGDLSLGGDLTANASARLDTKWSPRARDLDFTMANIDAAIRRPFAGASLGLGPTLSHVRVAGSRFRDGAGLRVDLAASDGADGHWAVLADGGLHRHGPGYEELDARVAGISVHRRIVRPFEGVAAVDVEAGLSRTANRYGFEDLSSRGSFARIAFESKLAGFDVVLALSGQQSRFDAGAFEDMAARRDRFVLVEIGVSHDLGKDTTIRADFTWGRNSANLAIYENRMRAFSVTLLSAY